MKISKPKVLVTFDSMKNANTGLFYFGLGLGNALLKNNKSFDLNFYLKYKNREIFKGMVKLLYLKKLHKLIFPAKRKFQLVHFTDQFCRLKPQLIKCKKVLTIHDLNPVQELKDNPVLLDLYFKKLGGFIKECDKIVAISKYVADDITHYFPGAKHKLSVIYNGADKLSLDQNHIPNYLPKHQFLFTIGNLSVKKNFHVLTALLENNKLELIISGIADNSSYREKIMAEADRYGCRQRIIITGPINNADKAWYYKNCMAFVFPSLAEGFGLPVIEAMYFGKPVFLSRFTSLPEVGGDLAYYFDHFEPKHLQQVFADGLKDYQDSSAEEAIKEHADKFSWDKTAQQYLKLYAECLAE
jgi:glycosyltransferase involved in cell wall biosynthesis